jgi:hypothetical protein
MAIIRALPLIFILLTGCGQKLDYLLKDSTRSTSELQHTLKVVVRSSLGTTLDLSLDRKKTTLLIFGQDTCNVCGEETERILASLQNGELPTQINIVTILIGATELDALDWQEMFEVSWPVGYDTTGAHFKDLCPEDTVPCLIVNRPDKGIVLRHHGAMSIDEIKEYTGQWYD